MRFRKPSPAMLVAVMALFVALGGSSYAAITLSNNSVKSKHIAKGNVKRSDIGKNAVNSAKVAAGSLLSSDFAAGQIPAGPQGAQGPQGIQGIQGEKGDPATNLFAAVTASGVLLYGKGVTGVTKGGTGLYFVTFDRALTNCVATVTIGFGSPAGTNTFQGGATGHPWIAGPSAGGATGVRVTTHDNANAAADQGFLIAVFC